jgi:lysine-specific demethylase/histidyl-hydroxylase NO66
MKTLESILNPISVNEFLTNNWCKVPLFLAKNDTTVNNLITMEDIGDLLDSEILIYPFLRMVGGGAELNRDLYTASSISVMQTLDRGKILNLFNKGNTIVLQSPNLYFPKLDKFLEDISRELGMRVHTNIYITPANSKGFDPHVDPHEVFVLQVYGNKVWNLYDIPYESPTKSIMLTNADKERYKSGPTHAINLQANDILYVPCGVVHDAYTTDSPSIHITLGLHPLRKIDILEKFVKEAEQHPFFRKSFFPIQDEFDSRESLTELIRESTKLIENIVTTCNTERNLNMEQERYSGVFKNTLTIDSVNTVEDINTFLQHHSKDSQHQQHVTDLMEAIETGKLSNATAATMGKIKFKLKDMVKQGSLQMEH